MAGLTLSAPGRPTIGISQTSVIFLSLLIAFVVFITIRGELSQYLAVLFGGSGMTTEQQSIVNSIPFPQVNIAG